MSSSLIGNPIHSALRHIEAKSLINCNYYGPLHMDEQKQGDQLEPTCSSSVRIWDVALRTSGKWWTIGRGGEKRSGISVSMARQDDEMMIYLLILWFRRVLSVIKIFLHSTTDIQKWIFEFIAWFFSSLFCVVFVFDLFFFIDVYYEKIQTRTFKSRTS